MAHVSLYRKYRPQTFSEVAGQSHVTQTLKRAIAEGRVSHAFLFSGPRGTGKTSTARILAKALNCETGGDVPCNTCSSCLQITEGASLDVVEIDAASHGSVDDAREIREKVSYSAVSGRWKVYIIDECHMLSAAANNALLKMLEEPPPHVVFVFATTEPHKVLQTLIDRCQRYEFRAVSTDAIALRLAEVCEAEGIAIDEDALVIVAARAAGSVRDALSLLEQLHSYAGQKIDADAVAQLLGSLPDDLLLEAVDIISERDAGAMFVFSDQLMRQGIDIRLFVHSIVSLLRSLFLVIHAPAAQEILDVPDERIEQLRARANRFDGAEILRLIDLANEAQLQLRQAVDPRLALEVALARMTRPELHASPSALLARIERLESLAGLDELTSGPGKAALHVPSSASPIAPSKKSLPASPARPEENTGPAATDRPRPPKPVPVDDLIASKSVEAEGEETVQGPPDFAKVQRAWPLLLDKVKRRKISFQALLLPARPVAYEKDELVLEFGPRSRFHKDKVSDRVQQEPLLEAFSEIFGMRPRIRCVLGKEELPEPLAPEERPDDAGPPPEGQSPPSKDPIDLIREAFSAEVIEES